MLRQEELAFIKAMGGLRKAMVASSKKKKNVPASRGATAIDAFKKKMNVPAPRRAATTTAQTSASKRKAAVNPTDSATDEPAFRRPAPGHLIGGEPEVRDATGEQAAQCSRQLGAAEGRLAYALVVAGVASLQMSSGPRKSTANGSASAEPATSPEAAIRRLSFEDKSGPLRGMPNGATTHTQVAASSAAPVGERPNKTPIFIADMGDNRAFLAWLRASCPGGLTAQLKGEKLMVVPSTADGFRATVSALRSLDGGKGVSFHTFTLPEDRCVRLLIKNLGKGMPESVVREELQSLDIRVQGVTQLRSGRRDRDPTKDRPPTHHFIVSVARGPEVSRVRSITEICGLWVSVE
jgi:hypothetical protein